MAELSGGIPLPLFLVVALGLMGAVAYVLRQWEQAVAVSAALIVGGLGIWLWRLGTLPSAQVPLVSLTVDLGASWERFGFVLEPKLGSLPVLALYFFLTAAAFGLSALHSQGRSLIPFVLLLLAGYSSLTLITAAPLAPGLIMPLLLVALTSGSVFVLQAGRLGNPRGALRAILPPMIAFPLFFLAAWHIDQIPLNPQDGELLATISGFLGLGLLILLAPFPLHGTHGASAHSAPPVVTATVNLFYELAILVLFHRLLTAYPFITTSVPLSNWLIWAGTLTAVWGGVAAVGTLHPGRLWGYVSLHDWGLIILALAMTGVRRWPLVLLLFVMRAISLMISASGLATLEQQASSLRSERMQGIGSRLPWSSALFVFGSLGLVGFPLTVGFIGHWSAIQMVAAIDWQLAAAILLASAGAVVAFVRLVRLLFGPTPSPEIGPMPERDHLPGIIATLGMLAAALALALSPQWVNAVIDPLLAVFR